MIPDRAPLTVDGIEVHVEGGGEDVVLMLHGWPDTHRLWDATVAALSPRWCCARATLPGFDITAPPRPTALDAMTQWLARVADAVSPGRPVTLLVHDWGCIFGYEFAARHPQRVARVIGVDIGDHNSGAYARSLGGRQRWMIFAYQFWLALAWMLGGWLPGVADRMTRRMARDMRCPTDPASIGWPQNYPYAMMWFGRFGGFRGAQRVQPRHPTLYFYGERKPFQFHSQRWLDAVRATPGGAVQAMSTGHWIMVQQPEAFHAAVADWLAATHAGSVDTSSKVPPTPAG